MTSARAAKKELILKKAFDLFCEKGYMETKIIDIADAAGIGKGTVYEYFGSKEDLFLEIFENYLAAHYYEALPKSLAGCSSAGDKLRSYIRFEMDALSAFGNGKNHVGTFTSDTNLLRDERIGEAMLKFLTFRAQTLSSILQEGISKEEFIQRDPELLSAALQGAINTFLGRNLNLTVQASEAPRWNEDSLMEILLGGIQAKA